MIADRMKNIDSSGIRKVFDLAAKIDDPVNLSIGQPDFDIPDEIKEEAIKAIREGFNRYTLTGGIPELIEPLKKKIEKDKKAKFEEVFITSGVSGGLVLAILATVNPGDQVIIPDPYFVMYKHLVNLVGGQPVFLDTYPDFRIDPDKLKKLINKKTKIILLNSPANPTGKVYSKDEIKEITSLLDGKILLISDEIYDEFVYETEFTSPASLYPNTLLLGGFSKTYAMTGWRIGYAAGPSLLIKEMIKLQQYTFVCAPSFAQKAAIKALDYDMSKYIEAYKNKANIVYEGLKDNFDLIKPQGAFYCFPKPKRNIEISKFVEESIKNKVLIIPGNVFSEKNLCFRLSFAAKDETIKKGIQILNNIVKTI